MKRFAILAMLALVIGTALPVLADSGPPPSGRQGKSNNASLTLVSKDDACVGATWAVIWPGPFGQLKYNISNPGVFQARLIVHHLRPNTWHLVTLQDANGNGKNDFLGSNGLFGVKPGSWGLEGFIDVALFKTNSDGDANVIIPTTSGLDGTDVLYPLLGTGALANGTYSGVTVVVKDVGVVPNPTAPPADRPNLGGAVGSGCWNDPQTPGLIVPDAVLFEAQAMETFKVGP